MNDSVRPDLLDETWERTNAPTECIFPRVRAQLQPPPCSTCRSIVQLLTPLSSNISPLLIRYKSTRIIRLREQKGLFAGRIRFSNVEVGVIRALNGYEIWEHATGRSQSDRSPRLILRIRTMQSLLKLKLAISWCIFVQDTEDICSEFQFLYNYTSIFHTKFSHHPIYGKLIKIFKHNFHLKPVLHEALTCKYTADDDKLSIMNTFLTVKGTNFSQNVLNFELVYVAEKWWN